MYCFDKDGRRIASHFISVINVAVLKAPKTSIKIVILQIVA